MRCFISLAVPEDVADAIADIQEGLPGASWTLEENLHLTLAFLGEVDRRTLEDVDSGLARLDAPAVELQIAGVGEFGGVDGRVAFARVSENAALRRLQAKVARAAADAGAPPPARRYTPHVTLARWSRRGVSGEALRAYEERHALFRAGPWTADAVRLMRSDLGRSGALHTELAAYPLR